MRKITIRTRIGFVRTQTKRLCGGLLFSKTESLLNFYHRIMKAKLQSRFHIKRWLCGILFWYSKLAFGEDKVAERFRDEKRYFVFHVSGLESFMVSSA